MSVISAIRQRFSIGQQHNAALSSQQGSAAKMSASRGAEGTRDEVAYVGLNDKDTDFDLEMMKSALEYDAYGEMADSDRENNKK